MASLIPGFENDIFISYRQKDNKHDGWVTEFVDNLKGELESTFKEEISVYFDINPVDGLLEIHDVDASLKDKLNCLVFIPVISRTYCDPRSFAWEHEFKAFVELASGDQFGLKLKLPNGNVANRVLPVRIHDLDNEDIQLCESMLGGVLRSVEFIYKSAGVNRPLRANEDHPQDNLNKAYYRDQVNKIANAIKEIIGSLKNYTSSVDIPAKKDPGGISKCNPEAFESIAVLPFANMSSDPEQEFFSDGISEEIINMLAQVPGLKVAGRTSSFSFKGKNQDIRIIGEQLNVNHVLEGSVRKSGNKIRIMTQLIKVADGFHLWSEKYDRQMEDIFDIQDEISMAILNAIKIKIFGSAKEAVLKKYTANPETYQLYLQGRFHYNKWAGAEGFNRAIDYFNAAIKIDPDYALAYAGIASSYFFLWLYNYLPPEKCLPQLKQTIHQALQLDYGIAESHVVMARMKFYYEWDFAGATIEFKKAIELNPNIAEAHEKYALCLGLLGNSSEAVKHASIAHCQDPFSLMINFNVAVAYVSVGDYEKELEFGKRLIELDPNFYGGHFHVGFGLMSLKRYQEALPEIETAVHLNNGYFSLHYLGLLYGAMGEKIKAREVIENMKTMIPTLGVGNCDFGAIYMALGEFDEAFQYFEKAVQNHEGRMLFLKYEIMNFPEFERDPRTKKIFDKIGLPCP